MAVVNNTNPIANIHGALAKGDKVIYRVRDGVQQAYVVKHPYDGDPTEKQTQARQSFKNLTQQVKAIYADPDQLAEWQDKFLKLTKTRAYRKALAKYLAYKREPQHIPYQVLPKHLQPQKPPTTLYGFILSELSKAAKQQNENNQQS